MTKTDVDYEVVGSAAQAGKPPELRSELVILPEWLNPRGKANAFWQWELSHGDHAEFERSDKVYDEAGRVIRFTSVSYAVRFLAYTTRDGDGNRIWPTIDQAEKALAGVGNSIINKMVGVANEMNYGDPKAKDAAEAAESAEGKSEETSTDS